MTVPSYTEEGQPAYSVEDIDLVARELHDRLCDPHCRESRTTWPPSYFEAASAVLSALHHAGRLVPPGSEVREEWGCRWPDGDWNIGPRSHAETYLMKTPGTLIERKVITSPWSPSVPDTESELS